MEIRISLICLIAFAKNIRQTSDIRIRFVGADIDAVIGLGLMLVMDARFPIGLGLMLVMDVGFSIGLGIMLVMDVGFPIGLGLIIVMDVGAGDRFDLLAPSPKP